MVLKLNLFGLFCHSFCFWGRDFSSSIEGNKRISLRTTAFIVDAVKLPCLVCVTGTSNTDIIESGKIIKPVKKASKSNGKKQKHMIMSSSFYLYF